MKIQFGAGGHIKKDWINVDLDKSQGADVAWNMETFPYPFPDNCADEILCEMTLEHIKTPSAAINEFHRIIKPDGIVKIVVPHCSHAYALVADMHISVFNVGYFRSRESPSNDMFNKPIPVDGWKSDKYAHYWKDVDVKIIFPQGNLKLISLPYQLIFNSSKIMQGVYEHFFSTFYRACEIHCTYTNKIKDN